MCSISFEAAGKKIGSLTVNLLRLVFGFTFLTITSTFIREVPFPVDAPFNAYVFLGISGFIGMFLGDLFMFEAFVLLGARITTLIMTLVPVITSLTAWVILGETLAFKDALAIIFTVGGIFLVMLYKGKNNKKINNISIKGISFAFMGVLGQALGLVFSKIGLVNYDPIAGTQIRLIIAFFAFIILITLKRKWHEVISGTKNSNAIKWIILGAFFGPFLGVSATLIALKLTSAGIVSTLSSTSPILVIPFSIIIFKEEVCFMEVLGAFLSVVGVSLFFI